MRHGGSKTGTRAKARILTRQHLGDADVERISPAPESIREALFSISPDLPRDEWVKVAMALKDGFGDDGFTLFDAWSSNGQSYNAGDCRDTWKSVRADGGVKIATLLYLARQHGWQSNNEGHREAKARTDGEQRHQEQAQRDANQEAQKRAKTVLVAWRIYGQADERPAPYLTKKGVMLVPGIRAIEPREALAYRSFGPKIDRDAGPWLVIPMYGPDDEWCGLEAIDANGGKGFMAGSKKGLFIIGTIEPSKPVAIVEGLATGISVFQGTQFPVVVAFDSGGLELAATAIKTKHPEAKILICGDRGNGQAEAEKAAAAVDGVLAIPVFPRGIAGTDWNDLHCAEGLNAVRAQIEAALPENSKTEVSKPGLLADYIDVSALDEMTFTRTWLVEKLVEHGRVYEWFGKWKNGKTIAVIDLCAHASLGLTWGDRRTVPTLIVWIAGESCEDVQRRLAAWRRRHGITDPMPFFIRTKPVHINVEAFAGQLAREVEALKAKYPGLPGLVIVDTVARSLSPDCNENSIEGLGAFANNVIDHVVRPTRCGAICVHHSGHGDTDRSRGWSGFPAAVDGSVKIEMDRPAHGPATITISAKQVRSGAGDDSLQFRVEVQEIPGTDNFGNQLEEPVLHYLGKPAKKAKEPTGQAQKALMRTLKEMTKERKGYRVGYKQFRVKCLAQSSDGNGMSTSTFSDALKVLVKDGLISHEDPEIWIPEDQNGGSDDSEIPNL